MTYVPYKRVRSSFYNPQTSDLKYTLVRVFCISGIRFSDDDGGSRFDHAKTYSTLPMRPKARRTEQHDILDPPYTSDTSALNVDAPITWMT